VSEKVKDHLVEKVSLDTVGLDRRDDLLDRRAVDCRHRATRHEDVQVGTIVLSRVHHELGVNLSVLRRQRVLTVVRSKITAGKQNDQRQRQTVVLWSLHMGLPERAETGQPHESVAHITRASGTQLDHFHVLSTLTVAKVREKIEGMVVLPPQQFVYIPRPDHAAVCTCAFSNSPIW
jgi:hypothetical protein